VRGLSLPHCSSPAWSYAAWAALYGGDGEPAAEQERGAAEDGGGVQTGQEGGPAGDEGAEDDRGGDAQAAGLLTWLTDLGWVRRAQASRAVHVTGEGRTGLATAFGIETPGAAERLRADSWAAQNSARKRGIPPGRSF